MALDYETRYPGQVAPASVNYPFGEAQNITIPGDGTGTPWEQDLTNDVFGLLQAILDEAGIVPNGNPDTAVISQYLQGVKKLSLSFANNILALLQIDTSTLTDGEGRHVKGFYSFGDFGGGVFYWNASANKANADGGLLIDPDNIGGFDGTTSTLSAYFADQGTGVGSGCWQREVLDNTYTPRMWGASGDGDTINNIEDDLALHQMFSFSPVGCKIRPADAGDVYVVSSRREYEDKYFDLGIYLKGKEATYWNYLMFKTSGSTPLPWFMCSPGTVLDGNKSEQWYMPAPNIATLDEYGVAYGKAYPDPTVDYHNPSSTTGLNTSTEDTTGWNLYSQGNRGIITVSNVNYFIGYNIEYKDLCRDGIVVQEIRKKYLTVGSRGDGQLLVNFSEMAGEGYTNPFEASYEKVVQFNTDDTAQEENTDSLRISQLESHFGDCAYAFFVRTNDPKYEHPLSFGTYKGTIQNCSRQGVWFERVGQVDVTLDTYGEYKINHPYRGNDGGVFLGNGLRAGTVRGLVVNGDINGNTGAQIANVNCEDLVLIKTKNDANAAIQNVNKAERCYVEAAGDGILAAEAHHCIVPISGGTAINTTRAQSFNTIGVKRHDESNQVFNPSAGTTAYVLSTATEPHLAGANNEAYIRVERKNPNIQNGTPYEISRTEWSVSGTGSSTTITTDFESATDDEITIYWVEVHTTTINSASGTTHTSTLAEAWEIVSVEIDGSPYTLADTRYGATLGATEYSQSRDSSNQIEVELGTAMTGTETVEIKVLPKIVTTAGTILLRGNAEAISNEVYGCRYQMAGEENKIVGGTLYDCPFDEAVLVDSDISSEVNDLTMRRIWGVPFVADDNTLILEFFGKGNKVYDCCMRGDTTDIGRNSVYGADSNNGVRVDLVEIDGGHYEQTGQVATTQETTYVTRTNGSTHRLIIHGTKRLGHNFRSGGADSVAVGTNNFDLSTAPMTQETPTIS